MFVQFCLTLLTAIALLSFPPQIYAVAPVVTFENYTLKYSYYGPAQSTAAIFDKAVPLCDLVVLSDSDSANLKAATFTLNYGFLDGDILSFTTIGDIVGAYNGGTGTLELTGTATVALYQAALRTVLFKATEVYDYRDVISKHTKRVSLTVTDDDTSAVSNDAHRGIDISAPLRIYTSYINLEIKTDGK